MDNLERVLVMVVENNYYYIIALILMGLCIFFSIQTIKDSLMIIKKNNSIRSFMNEITQLFSK